MKYLDIKTKTNFNVLIFLKCFSLDVPVFLFTIFRFFPFPINPPGLGDAYEQGLVKAVGVSNYGSDALRACHAKLASRGIPLVSNQVTLDLQDDLVEWLRWMHKMFFSLIGETLCVNVYSSTSILRLTVVPGNSLLQACYFSISFLLLNFLSIFLPSFDFFFATFRFSALCSTAAHWKMVSKKLRTNWAFTRWPMKIHASFSVLSSCNIQTFHNHSIMYSLI